MDHKLEACCVMGSVEGGMVGIKYAAREMRSDFRTGLPHFSGGATVPIRDHRYLAIVMYQLDEVYCIRYLVKMAGYEKKDPDTQAYSIAASIPYQILFLGVARFPRRDHKLAKAPRIQSTCPPAATRPSFDNPQRHISCHPSPRKD